MEIKPEDKTLEKLLTGFSTRYFVPDYQRDYAWTADEIEQLWIDVKSSFKNKSDYFLGALVLNKESHEEDQFDIVDGQQRLATFTILFAVLRDLAKTYLQNDNFLNTESRDLESRQFAEKIGPLAEDRLMYRSEPNQFYLNLNRKDQPIFKTNVQQANALDLSDDWLQLRKTENRVLKAKKILAKKVAADFFGYTPRGEVVREFPHGFRDLYSFLVYIIKSLRFISIEVATDYDAYLLFESLNYRGLSLSTADLVKNRLLMSCGDDEELKQQVLASWEQMVSQLQESKYPNPVDYLRFYWLAFYDERPTKNELYKVIKATIDRQGFRPDRFVSELLERVNHFVELTDRSRSWPSTEFTNDSLEQYLAEISSLRYSICLPSLLLAKGMNRTTLLKDLARSSVNFLVRLVTVGGYSVGPADEVFLKVVKGIRANLSDAEILNNFCVEKDKVADSIFSSNFAALRTRDSSVARYLLTKLHVYNAGPEQVPRSDEVHVEHILPQDPKKWVECGFQYAFGPLDDVIYAIGNQTLLNKKLNNLASNRPFNEKVAKYRQRSEFDEEGTTFPMTYRLHSQFESGLIEWTADRIQERSRYFGGQAPSIWPLPCA
jgi:uncharacterized protein with ParB-like and HNH nuclease domain